MSTPQPLLSTLIRRVHLAIRQQLHERVHAAGYTDLSPIHMYVFQTPGPDGARPSELAARTNMTKQAMNHVLGALEAGGYITRGRVPDDGRATVVRLTDRGRDVARIMVDGSKRLERAWARTHGAKTVDQLRALLTRFDADGR